MTGKRSSEHGELRLPCVDGVLVPENTSCGVGEGQNLQSAGHILAVRRESNMLGSMRARTGASATAPMSPKNAPMDIETGSFAGSHRFCVTDWHARPSVSEAEGVQ